VSGEDSIWGIGDAGDSFHGEAKDIIDFSDSLRQATAPSSSSSSSSFPTDRMHVQRWQANNYQRAPVASPAGEDDDDDDDDDGDEEVSVGLSGSNGSPGGMFKHKAGSRPHSTASSPTLFTMLKAMRQQSVLRALFVGCMLQGCQQFAGINTIMYYSATILKVAGFTSNSEAILLTIAITFVNFLAACSGLYFVDRIGRRPLTLGSLFAVTVALAITSVAFYFAERHTESSTIDVGGRCGGYGYCFSCVSQASCGFCSTMMSETDGSIGGRGCLKSGNFYDNTTFDGGYTCSSSDQLDDESCAGGTLFGWLIFGCMCLYLITFQPGLGPMPWCINSEIFPTSVRGTANSITTATNWTCNLVMSLTFLTLANALTNQGAYGLYAAIAACFLVFFYYYLPEAKGVPLEHVDMLFADDVWGRAWRTRKLEFAEHDAVRTDSVHIHNSLIDESGFLPDGSGGDERQENNGGILMTRK
jgi:MFS family permease